MKKHKKLFVLALFVLLLLTPVMVLAQDTGAGDLAPASMAGFEDQLAEALSVIMGQVVDLTLLPFAVPLVVILVALVKRIPLKLIQRIPAGTIHLVCQVVIWVAYAGFVKMGRADQFQAWTEGVIVVLQTMLPLVASLFGATWLYDKAKASAIPLLGYERESAAVSPFVNEGSQGKVLAG